MNNDNVAAVEHVAARRIHLLTRGGQLAKGKLHRAIVGALQSQLHHDHISVGIDAIELPVHFGERRAVVADRVGESPTAVGCTHGIVGEYPVGRKQADPAFQILPFRNGIRVADRESSGADRRELGFRAGDGDARATHRLWRRL